uniref:G_PROTEIN_RECEP_F1_2 domain-containing protein n=1 Tax=Meloidogyne hapla TaxID=6305 RepID=A0A1I8BBG1_MELHA
MLFPILSFSAADIDSYIAVPTLLMFVVAAGSNMPILYAFSKDYNKAFKKSFKHLFCGKQLETQTVSTTMQNLSNARNAIRMNIAKMNVNPVVNC